MHGLELPGVASLEVHRTLTSTSDRAREWIRDGVRPVAVVVAGEQTRGRGRGGRPWVSGAGEGLWMSVLLEAGDPAADGLLPLRTGLALARHLDEMPSRAGASPLRLKWPNDLFADGAKVGGVLCERAGDRLIVGVGLNCRAPVVDLPYPVAGLGGVDPEALLPVAVAAVLDGAGRSRPGLSAREIAEWRGRDLLTGTLVEAAGDVRGRAEGIDDEGRLRVKASDGSLRSVITGSVRPLQPNSW